MTLADARSRREEATKILADNKDHWQKGGAIAGGVSGALSGAAIGSAIPNIGIMAGAIIGTLFGRFVAGLAEGEVTGASLDGVIFYRYECVNCEHTFD